MDEMGRRVGVDLPVRSTRIGLSVLVSFFAQFLRLELEILTSEKSRIVLSLMVSALSQPI